MRDFPLQITKRKYGKEAHPSYSDMCALRQNKVYALQTRQDHEGSMNVITGMLKVFHFDIYVVLDRGANLSFFLITCP